MTSLPTHARIVVIGGGAIGTSVAYQLAKAGARDVLLVEKAQLTHGCTWHAAGLVGQLRTKANLTRLMQNSVAVFDGLEAETGQAVDWKRVGSLRLAGSEARWSEIRRTLSIARSFDFEAHTLSAREARDLFPFIVEDGIVGAAFIPSDGYVDPYSLTMAYAKGARQHGVAIREGVLVTDILLKDGRVTGIVTDHGTVTCEILVNCAGLWARRVGEMAGLSLPAGVVEHQYFVTEQTIDLPPGIPTLRDPDRIFYLKPDVRSFAIGGWEEGAPECWTSRPPFDFGRSLFPPDMDRLALFAEPAAERMPILNETGIRTIINGPIPVSADGEPIMGPVPGIENLFVACGFTAGIAASGGAGLAMAAWILDGDPGMDLWPFDVRRFGPHHGQSRHLGERARTAYAGYYKLHYPGEETSIGRGLRRSPVHAELAAAGARFGNRFGWERANWFAAPGDAPERPTFEDKPAGFDAVAREVAAIREGVALIDQTSFAKFEVTGPGAFAALQGLVANDLSGGPGKVTYTQILNPRGGIEADVTVLEPTAGRFVVMTGSGFGVRDGATLAAGLPTDGTVTLAEVTSAYAVLNLCGPASRTVLQSVSGSDLSNAAFPFLGCRVIEVGDATVVASRIGYVGELGYELLIPSEFAAHVYDVLKSAGAAHGLRDAGYKAIDSCRLEKGYLYWSADIGPDDDPTEAGLGFCVKPDKGPFPGRDALVARKTAGRRRKLVSFSSDGFIPLLGGEAILADGKVVGSTTSGGYGHHLKRSIAFGYIPAQGLDGASFALEAFGTRHPVTVGPRCLYDPKGDRLKS